MKKHTLSILLTICIFGFNASLFSQEKERTPVQILQAKKLKAGKTKNHQKLVGNVGIKYGKTKLYCDSAEINQTSNDFEAWGKVYINENDSIKAMGDYLFYDGQKEEGKLTGKDTRLISDKMTLTTDAIFFDKKNSMAYYLTPGDMRMEGTHITSNRGYYYTKSKFLVLKDSVVVQHPDYTITADTLKYATSSKTSYFLGPTDILLGKDKIYCEKGFYSGTDSIAQFEQNAKIEQKENILMADSIYYDKKTGLSDCFYNVVLIDTTNKITIKGNRGHFEQKNNSSYVTDSTLFIQDMKDDTLYLHADTLRAIEDSAGNKAMFAYHGVKLFKKDMQGVCDSLTYSFSDSLIRMFYEPIIWNGESQLTGDSISILTYDNKLQKLYINKNSFIISKSDSLAPFYDQVKGRNMIGHFEEGKLKKMDVEGNGQTIYYAKEDDGSYTGVNKAECSNITITFDNGKIRKIYFLEAPIATFYPVNAFPESESKLKGFIWKEELKPTSLEDLFKK